MHHTKKLREYINTVLIITTVPLIILFLFPVLFLPPLTVFTVSLCEFYFWRLVWDTDRFSPASGVDQVQNIIRICSVAAALLCTPRSNLRLTTSAQHPREDHILHDKPISWHSNSFTPTLGSPFSLTNCSSRAHFPLTSPVLVPPGPNLRFVRAKIWIRCLIECRYF
jgi:hypothetical protein